MSQPQGAKPGLASWMDGYSLRYETQMKSQLASNSNSLHFAEPLPISMSKRDSGVGEVTIRVYIES